MKKAIEITKYNSEYDIQNKIMNVLRAEIDFNNTYGNRLDKILVIEVLDKEGATQ
jgi:hypothetical protein